MSKMQKDLFLVALEEQGCCVFEHKDSDQQGVHKNPIQLVAEEHHRPQTGWAEVPNQKD